MRYSAVGVIITNGRACEGLAPDMINQPREKLPKMAANLLPRELLSWSLMAVAMGAMEGGLLGIIVKNQFSDAVAPALVNLDFKVTFTPKLLRKDLDLGLDAAKAYEVPMPLTSITRDIVQTLIGHGMDEEDFAQLIVLQARASGIELQPENVPVDDGLH